jgi:hypothetical protein
MAPTPAVRDLPTAQCASDNNGILRQASNFEDEIKSYVDLQ